MFESMTNVKLNQITYFQTTAAFLRTYTHRKIHFSHHLRAQSLSIQSKARQLVRIQCGKVLSKRDRKHVDRQRGLAQNISDNHKSCGQKVPQGLFNFYQKKKNQGNNRFDIPHQQNTFIGYFGSMGSTSIL